MSYLESEIKGHGLVRLAFASRDALPWNRRLQNARLQLRLRGARPLRLLRSGVAPLLSLLCSPTTRQQDDVLGSARREARSEARGRQSGSGGGGVLVHLKPSFRCRCRFSFSVASDRRRLLGLQEPWRLLLGKEGGRCCLLGMGSGHGRGRGRRKGGKCRKTARSSRSGARHPRQREAAAGASFSSQTFHTHLKTSGSAR